jgi:hypothetical protein
MLRFTSITLVLLAAACSSNVDAGGAATKRLPVAVLDCPDHVDPSATFTIDGSKSSADGALKTISLTVQPGNLTATTLSAQFHIDTATVATAVLVVTDADQNSAQARCRFAVGDPNAQAALPPSPPPPSDSGEGEGEGATTPPPPPGVPVDLNGRFALVAYDRPKTSGLAMFPETQCGDAPTISLVDITQTDAHVSMTVTTCVVQPMPVQIDVLGWEPVELTAVPSSVVAAMAPIGPVEFDLDAAVQGARFAPPLSSIGKPQTVGATLTDPNGTLPTDGSDPQVDDADHDGNPGVTITNTATYSDGTSDAPAQEFVVMRHAIRAFAGTITSSDQIDGTDLGDYQADEGMSLLSSLEAMFLPSGAGLPSTFMMSRVDASTTCAQIQAAPDSFLAALPAPSAPSGCAAYPDYTDGQ